MKSLVAYFSASGVTAKVAKAVAAAAEADLLEIRPEKPYSSADLNWMNPMARCNWEKFGKKDVPVAGTVERMDVYDTIYLGFPIWYGCTPNVINTFLKGYDMSGKRSRCSPLPAEAAWARLPRNYSHISAVRSSLTQSYSSPQPT